MTALQASIGILNDVVDAPRDAGRKPGKPIPAGHRGARSGARRRRGRRRPRPRARGAVGSRRRGSWRVDPRHRLRLRPPLQGHALVVGCPSRSGSRCCPSSPGSAPPESLPPFMGRLVLAAVLAGAALAIANARADVERDRAAGVASVATALGAERAWWLALGLCLAILAVAAGPVLDAVAAGSPPTVALIGVVAGAALLLVGAAVGYRAATRASRTRLGAPGRRDRRAGGGLAGRRHRPALSVRRRARRSGPSRSRSRA